MSSALELEKEIIRKRYHPASWNIYTFYSGDGDNFSFDDAKVIDLFRELKEISQMVCYAEIDPFSPPGERLVNHAGGALIISLVKSQSCGQN